MSPVRIVVADDHALVRAGVCALLGRCEGLQVVGEAANGREAVALVERTRPHVVLMDVAMPELSGLEATARIVRALPETRVLIVSMHASEEHVLQALQAGASGYVLKNAPPDELERAVRAVARGEKYLSSAMSAHVIDDYVRRVTGETPGPAPGPPLTSRQREVLQLVAEGNTTKDIARKLGLSVKTVEKHRSQIMQRLGIHDVAGLARYAVRKGLVPPEA